MLGGWSFTGDAADAVTVMEVAKKLSGYDISFSQGCPVLSRRCEAGEFGANVQEEVTEQELEEQKIKAVAAAKRSR